MYVYCIHIYTCIYIDNRKVYLHILIFIYLRTLITTNVDWYSCAVCHVCCIQITQDLLSWKWIVAVTGFASVINIFLMLMPSRYQGKDSLFLNFCIIKHHAIHRKLPQYHWCKGTILLSPVQSQSCMTLCNPMDCSTPGFPVHHQFLEIVQTHVHPVGDAIQPSHLLLFPSPLAFSLSQHQGLFKWVSSSNQVAKGLEFQLQHQSFQWIFRTDFL